MSAAFLNISGFTYIKNQINERASSICSAVGRPTAVRGDCLISRFVDHEAADIFERKDFTLDDLASDKSAFVVEARANATVCSSWPFCFSRFCCV